jgi:hypothetical protein
MAGFDNPRDGLIQTFRLTRMLIFPEALSVSAPGREERSLAETTGAVSKLTTSYRAHTQDGVIS